MSELELDNIYEVNIRSGRNNYKIELWKILRRPKEITINIDIGNKTIHSLSLFNKDEQDYLITLDGNYKSFIKEYDAALIVTRLIDWLYKGIYETNELHKALSKLILEIEESIPAS